MEEISLVAPPAGAWIETGADLSDADLTGVAPPAGAWIETALSLLITIT